MEYGVRYKEKGKRKKEKEDRALKIDPVDQFSEGPDRAEDN